MNAYRPLEMKKPPDLGGGVGFDKTTTERDSGSNCTLGGKTLQARREFSRAADHWLLDAATYARDGDLDKASLAARRALKALARLRQLTGGAYLSMGA